jgi:O-antigen/teichoic acid export membrane protein
MYLRGTSYSVGIAIPVTIGGLILARPIIRSWVGPGLDPSIGPTRLLLGLLALISVHVVGSAMIVALGKTRSIILITSSAVAVNLVASIALVGPLGVEGVIIGSIIGQAIAWAPLLRLLLREFGVPLGEWLRTVALPVLPAAVVQALLTLPLLALVSDSQSFPLVGAALVASVAIGVVAFVLLGLRGGERARLVDTFRQAFRPRSPTPVQPEGPA